MGIQLLELIMTSNIVSNYNNILTDNAEYDQQINANLIRPSLETPVVTKPSRNQPETMLNKNLSLEILKTI